MFVLVDELEEVLLMQFEEPIQLQLSPSNGA